MMRERAKGHRKSFTTEDTKAPRRLPWHVHSPSLTVCRASRIVQAERYFAVKNGFAESGQEKKAAMPADPNTNRPYQKKTTMMALESFFFARRLRPRAVRSRVQIMNRSIEVATE